MNSVTLIGRLTKDPELSYTPQNQIPVCRFTLAVDKAKKTEGQSADFIRITVWDKQAVNCDRYLRKGSQCAVQGRIQTGSYKNKNGETVYTTDVVGDRVEFLGSAPQNTTEHQSAPQQTPRNPEDTFSAVDDSCPF